MRKINRHAQMRKHKREMKKRFGILYCWNSTNTTLAREECEREKEWRGCDRNNGYVYWKTFYLTGCRHMARNLTNRTIRSAFRNMLHNLNEDNIEDVCAMRGSDYTKVVDYNNFIF